MVLVVNGSLKYFDSHLLTLMRQHKNAEVRKIFDDYHADASRPLVSSLMDSKREATLLHYAAEYGNDTIAQYLIDLKSKIDHRDVHGRIPLMSSLIMVSGSEATVRVLLRAGSNIHSIDKFGENILQMMCRHSYSARMIEVLLKEVQLSKILMIINGEQTIDDEISRKPVSKEKLEAMKILLSHRDAYVSIRDGTLLHKAVELQLFESAKVLLDYGTNADALDSRRAIPLYYLYNYKNKHSNQALEMLKILVSRSTRLTTSANDGRMQIYKLLKYENGDAIETLVRSPYLDLNASDGRGNTALHYLAVNNKNPGVFSRLRGLKFDVDARDKDGYTPLHKAVAKNSLESVKFWLENGADVNDCAHESNRTPLYSAYELYGDHSKSIVELLCSYGADPQPYAIRYHSEWTIFDLVSKRFDRYGFNDLTEANPAIERLAIVEALGTEITSRTRSRIEEQASWMQHLNACRRMIKTVVYGDVTVLVILTASDKRMMAYARNKELVFQLNKIIDENTLYKNLLRTRLENAIDLVELEDKAIEAISNIFCLGSNVFYTVAHFVMDHLSKDDMKNLCSALSELTSISMITSSVIP